MSSQLHTVQQRGDCECRQTATLTNSKLYMTHIVIKR